MALLRNIIVVLLLVMSFPLRADNDFCTVRNSSFIAGETLNFKVFYTVAGLYVAAGEASFNNSLEMLNNRPVYHIVGDGKTYPFYDGFFKVRDRYESFIDTTTLQPLKFIR